MSLVIMKALGNYMQSDYMVVFGFFFFSFFLVAASYSYTA